MAGNKKISDLTAGSTPTGTEFIEALQGGTNVKLTAQQIADLAGSGTTFEFDRAWSSELLFDKNEIYYADHTQTGAINFTIAAAGNLVDGSSTIVQRITSDGTNTISFTGFDPDYIKGITSGDILPAGDYEFFFLYRNGEVSVSVPGDDEGGTITEVNGQTGPIVTLDAGDIANTPAGGIAATTVQAAIDELDSEKASTAAVTAAITAALEGLKWKDSVKVATTVNGTLATAYENGDTVDGIALVTGDRILLKNQTTQTENGIYIVAASGAPARSSDANSAAELEGATVTVQQGTSNANTTWTQTTDGITLGSSNIVWSQFGTSVPDASDTVKGIVELATPAEVITGTSTTLAVTPEGLQGKVIGVQDLFIPAAAMWPRNTNGCAALAQTELATSLINIKTLDFDPTTEEYAQFHFKFPRKYNLGTITASFEWITTSGSGSVVWKLGAVAISDNEAMTATFGTPQLVTDAAQTTNTLRNSADTAAITIAGSPAAADGIFFQVAREAGNGSDDYTPDAKLSGIWLHITTNAAKDA